MRKRLHIKHPLAMLSLAGLFWLGPSAMAQVSAPPPNNGQISAPPQADRDNDATRGELANMDRFLDSHPEIAEQVRKDPSLVNNREFVENHPALGEFLQNHPGVREEVRENPNAFMTQENGYDRREDDRGRDRDGMRTDMASMDRFLDRHPEIAEQVRKNPSLLDNRQFLENHPALKDYLEDHPEVREDVRQNPNAFMRQEDRYDRREDDRREYGRDRDRQQTTAGFGDRDNRGTSAQFGDRDRDRETSANFGEFLHGHTNVASELSRDPSLANNREYMANHPELANYLKEHPEAQRQLTANPQEFMKSAQVTSPAVKNPSFPTPKENH